MGLAVTLRQIQALPASPPSARLPELATHRTCLLFTFTKAALTSSQRLSRSYWVQNQEMTKNWSEREKSQGLEGREERRMKTVQGRLGGRKAMGSTVASRSTSPKLH